MTNRFTTIIIASVFALGLAGCETQKAPGKYETMESSTDANGTTTTKQTTDVVTVDPSGHKKEVVTTKTSTDPKGLLNKTTSQSTEINDEN